MQKRASRSLGEEMEALEPVDSHRVSAQAKKLEPSQRAVLVVIPSLNEAEHIEGLVTKLLGDTDHLNLKIVIVDGGSTDNTRAIVQKLSQREERVILLDNQRRLAAAAVNEAVCKYGDDADFLIRVDAHADYPPDYCARLLAVQSETRADSVVVSMMTRGRHCFQRAVAAAQNSILGNGGSPHRNPTKGRWVDHGHHALMRIEAFRSVGGYDESFFSNEDAELDVRLRAAGFQIYLAGDLSIGYFPRRSVVALFRQYYGYGRGRARNFLKHREKLRLRQMLPLTVAPVLAMLLLIPVSAVFAVPALLWGLFCLGYGVWLGIKAGELCTCWAGIAAMAMHAGWSFGFLGSAMLGLLTSKERSRNAPTQA
jgi:succinoglycan biosynthesis protein ExoA